MVAWMAIAQGASSFLEAGGQWYEAEANAAASRFNADMASLDGEASLALAGFNARVLRGEKELVEASTKDTLQLFGRQVKRLLATQRTAYTAAGVRSDTGSAADVRRASVSEANQEAIRIAWSGLNQATRLENQARISEYQGQLSNWRGESEAKLRRAEAENYETAGIFSAITSLIGGGSKTFSMLGGKK